ncbi:MAG: secretin, partial [Bradyrhizobium icense]
MYRKCGDNPVRSNRLRMLSFSAVAALALYPALSPTSAAESDASKISAAASAATGDQAPLVTGSIAPTRSRFLALGVGKSVVVDLPRDAKDVLVADPKIANAVIRSSQRAYIIGSAVGQTNVV